VALVQVDEVVETARRLAPEGTFGAEQATTLRSVLTHAARVESPIFALMFDRLAEVGQ
jgi:hypothetical protein